MSTHIFRVLIYICNQAIVPRPDLCPYSVWQIYSMHMGAAYFGAPGRTAWGDVAVRIGGRLAMN